MTHNLDLDTAMPGFFGLTNCSNDDDFMFELEPVRRYNLADCTVDCIRFEDWKNLLKTKFNCSDKDFLKYFGNTDYKTDKGTDLMPLLLSYRGKDSKFGYWDSALISHRKPSVTYDFDDLGNFQPQVPDEFWDYYDFYDYCDDYDMVVEDIRIPVHLESDPLVEVLALYATKFTHHYVYIRLNESHQCVNKVFNTQCVNGDILSLTDLALCNLCICQTSELSLFDGKFALERSCMLYGSPLNIIDCENVACFRDPFSLCLDEDPCCGMEKHNVYFTLDWGLNCYYYDQKFCLDYRSANYSHYYCDIKINYGHESNVEAPKPAYPYPRIEPPSIDTVFGENEESWIDSIKQIPGRTSNFIINNYSVGPINSAVVNSIDNYINPVVAEIKGIVESISKTFGSLLKPTSLCSTFMNSDGTFNTSAILDTLVEMYFSCKDTFDFSKDLTLMCKNGCCKGVNKFVIESRNNSYACEHTKPIFLKYYMEKIRGLFIFILNKILGLNYTLSTFISRYLNINWDNLGIPCIGDYAKEPNEVAPESCVEILSSCSSIVYLVASVLNPSVLDKAGNMELPKINFQLPKYTTLRTFSGIKKFVSDFVASLQSIFRWAFGDKAWHSIAVNNSDEELVDFIEFAFGSDSDDFRRELNASAASRDKVKKYRIVMNKWLKIFCTGEVRPNHYFLKSCEKFRICSNLVDRIEAIKGGIRREEPFSIYIEGGPGLGKSEICTEMVKELIKVDIDGMNEQGANLICSRSNSSKYFDNYDGQFCMLFDDLGQNKDPQFNPWNEYFDCVGTTPYYPPMAHLETKGIPFTSKLVMATANVAFPTPNSVSSTLALWRRRHVLIQCTREGGLFSKQMIFKVLDPTSGHEQPLEIFDNTTDLFAYLKMRFRKHQIIHNFNSQSRIIINT
jgi:hypothetical protein